MKVLSLFDGISCGRVALDRAGIPVECYAAFEIDKFAVQISAKNYPDIQHFGNVFDGDFKAFRGYDLLMGGSPCTYWSIARHNRETTADGEGFRLFMQYVRALKEAKPRYFLYENNYSIHKNIKAEISKQLGVEPIMINSALVSAQQRKRCYWTNIPGITQPEDRHILINDILEIIDLKSNISDITPMRVAEGTKKGYVDIMPGECVDLNYANSTTRCGRSMREKSNCLTTSQEKYQYCGTVDRSLWRIENGFIKSGGKPCPIKIRDGRYIIRKLSPIEWERLQTLPDNYTSGVSDTQRYRQLGNGWTVDVIAHILSFLPHL